MSALQGICDASHLDRVTEPDLSRVDGLHRLPQPSHVTSDGDAVARGALSHLESDAQPVDRVVKSVLLVLATVGDMSSDRGPLQLSAIDHQPLAVQLVEEGFQGVPAIGIC